MLHHFPRVNKLVNKISRPRRNVRRSPVECSMSSKLYGIVHITEICSSAGYIYMNQNVTYIRSHLTFCLHLCEVWLALGLKYEFPVPQDPSCVKACSILSDDFTIQSRKSRFSGLPWISQFSQAKTGIVTQNTLLQIIRRPLKQICKQSCLVSDKFVTGKAALHQWQ
jgi:hypothetical protein